MLLLGFELTKEERFLLSTDSQIVFIIFYNHAKGNTVID